jgi:hypothetical protein
VRHTVEGARARVATASCQGLLEEFKTPDGTSLKERLESDGSSLEARLQGLHFFDASELPACRSSGIYAFTRPALGAVYVCTSRFTAARLQDPALAEAVVIHELLHTIGLGEYPPTPEHITARVKDRCHAATSASGQ